MCDLPFGGNVLLHIGKGTEAMVLQESAAVFSHEVVDGLTPPARMTETGELQNQVPEEKEQHTHCPSEQSESLRTEQYGV